MKQCSKCKKTKPFNEFHKSSTNSNGYNNYCKLCQSEYAKAKYDSRRVHPAKIKEEKMHCRRCNQYLSFDKFPKQKKYQSYCKECRTHIGRKHNLYKLGVSVEKYIELEKQQDYKCKICGGSDKKRLSVDHNHSCCNSFPACGTCIRGLLCSRCNRALGIVNDDISLLKKMIDYLS
jgi:hypothetical protein